MARASNTHRDNVKRKKLQAKDKARRDELRAKSKQGDDEATAKLQELPRDSSYIRNTRRCKTCGRPHGVVRRFGM